MKLAQLREVMAEVKRAIPAEEQQGDAVCIVDAEVFGNEGEYNLAVKKAAVDKTARETLSAIANKHNLHVISIKDYLVLCRT